MLEALQKELDAVAVDESAASSSSPPRARRSPPGHDLKQMRAEPSLGYYEALFAQCAR
jgi:hypothetical protein